MRGPDYENSCFIIIQLKEVNDSVYKALESAGKCHV